jgi:hypothetical protein
MYGHNPEFSKLLFPTIRGSPNSTIT